MYINLTSAKHLRRLGLIGSHWFSLNTFAYQYIPDLRNIFAELQYIHPFIYTLFILYRNCSFFTVMNEDVFDDLCEGLTITT
jgi:hypothetical protein